MTGTERGLSFVHGPDMDYLATRLPRAAQEALATLEDNGFRLAVSEDSSGEWLSLRLTGPIHRKTLSCGCLANSADAHRVGCPTYPEGKRP